MRCGDFVSSSWGLNGDWDLSIRPEALRQSRPQPQPAGRHSGVAQLRAGLSLPSGRISALVLRKLSHNRNPLLQNYSGLTQNLVVSCQREGLLWVRVGSWGLLLPHGHPTAAPRAAPSRQAQSHRCLLSPFSSSSRHCHELDLLQLPLQATELQEEGLLFSHFLRAGFPPLPSFDWHWICFRP